MKTSVIISSVNLEDKTIQYVDELVTTLTEQEIRTIFYSGMLLPANDVYPDRELLGLIFINSNSK